MRSLITLASLWIPLFVEANPPPIPTREASPPKYPLRTRMHPLVKKIPKSVETSWQSVARYIAEHERDPFQRTKAIHDYIADRVRYDVSKKRGLQDPKTVFETRLAVCDGYSQLFEAMVDRVGGHAEYLAGDGHAWNAVEIEGEWYLVDVTWDAGVVMNGRYKKQYTTKYLLEPSRHMTTAENRQRRIPGTPHIGREQEVLAKAQHFVDVTRNGVLRRAREVWVPLLHRAGLAADQKAVAQPRERASV
jgi:hypothetical protein